MSFLKNLFKPNFSNRPEDYHRIFVRWEIGGQEYGPVFFDDMITRNWSGPPIEGRFENENIWRKYEYFLEILNNLKVSQSQLSTLKKYNVSIDESNLKFQDAIKIIKDKEEEIKKQRTAERREKEKLPATKKTLKKLKTYGIKYPENITRAEAKILVYKYEEKESLKQILNDFTKMGMDISSKFDMEVALNESANNFSFTLLLEDMYDLFTKLSKFDINFTLPERLNTDSILEINNKIEDALSEAEDAKEQIKDRNFSTLEADYKIIGKLPTNNFYKFNKEIIEKRLYKNWDFERDIINLLMKHFPEIKLKKEEY